MSLIFATQLTAVATIALAVLACAAAIAGSALRKRPRELAILLAENNRQAGEPGLSACRLN